MWVVIRDTIGDAHQAIIELILEEGHYIVTENGEETCEVLNLHAHVENPFQQPMNHPASPYGDKFLHEYYQKIISITPWKGDGTDAVYTYGNRLRDFALLDALSGMGHGVDQLDYTIRRLQKSRVTRRAVMCTWAPSQDLFNPEPPCIDIIQFIIREGRLNLTAYIRSNDMLMAWGANCWALAHLLQYAAHECGVAYGWIETVSMSAHIYYHRDQPDLDRFRRYIHV